MVPEAVAAPPPSARAWRLVGDVATQTQGLVATAFGRLECAEALFLNAPTPGNAWLAALLATLPVTAAVKDEAPIATALAFTVSGLARLGLPPAVLGEFAAPFVEGMHEVNRARRLGDSGDDAPVLQGGPRWSGNPAGALRTPATVHALLLLYAADAASLQAQITKVEGVLAAHGAEILRSLKLSLRRDPTKGNVPREHFGFADGFSQPTPFDAAGAVVMNRTGQPWQDPWHGVPLGELLLGHINAHNEPAPTPLVHDDPADPAAQVLPCALAAGMRDLGRNGSYLVARELSQDVAAFWSSMQEAANALGQPGQDAEWLAARVVGRERDGGLLTPEGSLAPRDGMPENDVGFRTADRHGMGCPIGSHVRRANPRDGTGATAAEGTGQLEATNNHRILRRGRKFGPEIADPLVDDGVERGLLFLCLNTDIARQFEFVQQTWMLNRGFQTLHGETDPLMGPRGPFTMPCVPLRQRVAVETFVRFVGGEYFFLPSLPALEYLAAMQPAAG